MCIRDRAQAQCLLGPVRLEREGELTLHQREHLQQSSQCRTADETCRRWTPLGSQRGGFLPRWRSRGPRLIPWFLQEVLCLPNRTKRQRRRPDRAHRQEDVLRTRSSWTNPCEVGFHTQDMPSHRVKGVRIFGTQTSASPIPCVSATGLQVNAGLRRFTLPRHGGFSWPCPSHRPQILGFQPFRHPPETQQRTCPCCDHERVDR